MSKHNEYEDWQSEEPDFLNYRRTTQNLFKPSSKRDGARPNDNNQKGGSKNPFKRNDVRDRARGTNRFPSGLQKRKPDTKNNHSSDNSNRGGRRPDNQGNSNNKGNNHNKKTHNEHHKKSKHHDNTKKSGNNKRYDDKNNRSDDARSLGSGLLGFSRNQIPSSKSKPQKTFERTYLTYDLHLWNSRQLSSIRYLEKTGLLRIENETKAFIGHKVRIRFRSVITISHIQDRLAGPFRAMSKRVN